MATSRFFISTKDIMQLTGKSYNAAYKEKRAVMDALDKKKHQKLSFIEYANFFDQTPNEIKKALGL